MELDADRRDPSGVRWSNHGEKQGGPRPFIRHPDTGRESMYTRVTSYIGCLEDTANLDYWKRRTVMLGLAADPTLFEWLRDADPDDRDYLDAIGQEAFEAGRGYESATKGTELHALTERADAGLPLGDVSDADRADLTAYQDLIRDNWIAILATERRVVVDGLRVTGTFDRLVRHNHRTRILDIKTGASMDFGRSKMAMQLALYSRGVYYDGHTGERTPLDDDVDLEVGLICHVGQGTGRAELYEVDLTVGWAGVLLARRVREWRNVKCGFAPVLADPWAAA